jgi:hypothetical protein
MKKVLWTALLVVATLGAIMLVIPAGIQIYDACGKFIGALQHITEPYYRKDIFLHPVFIIFLSGLTIGACSGYFAIAKAILGKMKAS